MQQRHSTKKRFSGILFDLDGTLIDTIGVYERAFLQALKEEKRPVEPGLFRKWYAIGYHLKDIARIVELSEARINALRMRRDELYRQKLSTEAQWIEGAEELLTRASAIAPIGVVTGSWMSYLDAMRPRADITKYTDVIIAACKNISPPSPSPSTPHTASTRTSL